MSTQVTGTIPNGKMVSFKLEKEVLNAAQKQAFNRMIPLSMWLREAAREKLAAKRKAAASAR